MPRSQHQPHMPGAVLRGKLRTEEFTAWRVSNDNPDPQHIEESPCSDSYTVIIQLKDFVSHQSWRGGHLVYSGGHIKGSMAIAYQGDNLRCRNFSAFDNLRFSIPRTTLDAFAPREELSRVGGFDCDFGTLDPVFAHLAHALLPALGDAEGRNRLFVDEIMMAMCTHVATHYGYARSKAHCRTALAPWQERRAKELMLSHLDRELPLARLAEECGMSRSYFARAFNQCVGVSPHRWLTRQRIERAMELLGSARSLADIAIHCGFSDQAHLTRTFVKLVGVTPSRWRRSLGG